MKILRFAVVFLVSYIYISTSIVYADDDHIDKRINELQLEIQAIQLLKGHEPQVAIIFDKQIKKILNQIASLQKTDCQVKCHSYAEKDS